MKIISISPINKIHKNFTSVQKSLIGWINYISFDFYLLKSVKLKSNIILLVYLNFASHHLIGYKKCMCDFFE